MCIRDRSKCAVQDSRKKYKIVSLFVHKMEQYMDIDRTIHGGVLVDIPCRQIVSQAKTTPRGLLPHEGTALGSCFMW